MSALPRRWPAILLVAGPLTLLCAGCVVPDGGSVGVGVDYYEPYATDYGGWGTGYRVAPFRGGGHDGDRGGRRGGDRPHAYRAAPAGHATPSIPSGARPGGGRGGGGRPGGGQGGGGRPH